MNAIVVLTPVRNEAWILDKFLAVASQFADRIIVADQRSTDGSREICRRFPKVDLIENRGAAYDEASRQRLLIDRAREIVPGPRVLLALDADEILAGDSLHAPGWDALRRAGPGTVFYFEKPDLISGTARCVRYPDSFWPLAFVDDGTAHQAKRIHSIRIPVPAGAPARRIDDIRFVHYGLVRISAVDARMRYYSVQENIAGTTPWYRRRMIYSARHRQISRAMLEPSVDEWFTPWESQGIAVRAVEDAPFYWWDAEVLRAVQEHGRWRFCLDDIWNVEWNARLTEARARGLNHLPSTAPMPPPIVARWLAPLLESAVLGIRRARRAGR